MLHDTDGERSKTVLAPLREGAVKPVFEKFSTFPDMLAVSHVADAGLKAAPRRLVIRGAAFSDVYPELLLAAFYPCYRKLKRTGSDSKSGKPSDATPKLVAVRRLDRPRLLFIHVASI